MRTERTFRLTTKPKLTRTYNQGSPLMHLLGKWSWNRSRKSL